MSALSVRNLQYKYAFSKILCDINLDLAAGETLALVGPSGCGKSTLLHIIAGLLTPCIRQTVIKNSFKKTTCMFQEPRLLPWKTAEDNITLGLKALKVPKSKRQQQAKDIATRLGLSTDDLSKYPHELSGGMQSRIALGRALMIQPDLLLLDEPFSALDIGLKIELYTLLRQYTTQHDTAVLMITHDLMEAVRLADRIIMMIPNPGRLIEAFSVQQAHAQRTDAWVYQTTAELMSNQSIRSGFGLQTAPRAAVAPADQPHWVASA